MNDKNNEEVKIGEMASALVMLAAIATTFTTYVYYKDDVLATQYEADQASLEQTASALLSLRLSEEALAQATTTEEIEE
jgi:hypothetical protein